MNILFYSSHDDISAGSYRIWVRDLNDYFNDVGVSSKVAIRDLPDLTNFDVVIFGKSDYVLASKIKKSYSNKKIGVINHRADVNIDVDFIIVGSIEEQASLSYYDNVFLFPLIEKMYIDSSLYKNHQQADTLRIGFHGHPPHISKFVLGMNAAIEELSKQISVEFLVASSGPINNTFLPNANVIGTQWNFDTIADSLLSCDIGVVPNAVISGVDSEAPNQGLFDTDYSMRFKNKSNAGRAFVFHQLGIPVVADITPSHFHVMGNPDCGFLVADKAGWYKALLKLTNYRTRQEIADNAKKEFDRLYDPHDWARKLYREIEEI